MRFLLTGLGTLNKGAELMLYAILQEIERKFPDSTVYIDKRQVTQGAEYVHTSLKFKLLPNIAQKIVVKLHVNDILRRLRLPQVHVPISIPKVDYMIDGSGLHFTDQMTNSEDLLLWKQIFKQVRSYEAKVIFLPQGFGPIEKDTTKQAVRLLFENADLVYAREHVSYEYLSNLCFIDKTKLNVCTDFTSLVEGSFPEKYDNLKNAVCIIPNMQMVAKQVVTLEEYISYLLRLVQEIESYGKNVYLLNHEGERDNKLMSICKEHLGSRIETVNNLNALEVKGLISSAYMVISSRFHGVASALNSCVPCLATSWSHKYQCLFEDYGMDDCVLSIKDYEKDIIKIQDYLNAQTNREIRKHLQSQLPRIKEETTQMWKAVWKV